MAAVAVSGRTPHRTVLASVPFSDVWCRSTLLPHQGEECDVRKSRFSGTCPAWANAMLPRLDPDLGLLHIPGSSSGATARDVPVEAKLRSDGSTCRTAASGEHRGNRSTRRPGA